MQDFDGKISYEEFKNMVKDLDVGGKLFNECFNPTEAGCERDMAGPTSTSRLRYLSAGDREFVRETLVAVRTRTTATAQNPGGLSPR